MVQENILADCLPDIWLSVVSLVVIGLLAMISQVVKVCSTFGLSNRTSGLLFVGTRPTAATFGQKKLGGPQKHGLVWFLSDVMGLFAECTARVFLVPALSLNLATSPLGTKSARVKLEAIQADRSRRLHGPFPISLARQ